MGEAAIIRSPHAYIPTEKMTEVERRELYRTRIDGSFKPYTVINVIEKVYHRNFFDDLTQYIGSHPEAFKSGKQGWGISRAWVKRMKLIRPESVFFQPMEDFKVDILFDAVIRFEDVKKGDNEQKSWRSLPKTLRLRYSFDFRPCHLDCNFTGAVLDEADSLHAMDPVGIKMSNYLLPVLKDDRDYRMMAYYLKLTGGFSDGLFDPSAWVSNLGLQVKESVFPEDGVLGEYFFSFGTADIVDPVTKEVHKDAEIDPGTILLSREIMGSPGRKNSTLTHEGVHHVLGRYFFMLQKTHGHQYCSYMCKRKDIKREMDGKWTPVDIMELQANKLPGHLLIPEETGIAYAEKLLESYGGGRSIQNMTRLVEDMASHYTTTMVSARTRLLDFGFREVKGVLQAANGNLVPSYISNLGKNETYTVDEADGIQEYIGNEEFRKLIDSGRYVYVEGHYCLNEPRYVRYDQRGEPHLSNEARINMSSCCLVFENIYKDSATAIRNGVLTKKDGRGGQRVIYRRKDGSPAETLSGKEQLASIMKEKADLFVVEKTFNDLTSDLMKCKNLTVDQLAEKAGLSRETIKNMRNNPMRRFAIEEVVAVAIAMHLPPEVSSEYIRKSPSKFMRTDEMYVYRYALREWYRLEVSEVNRKLVEMGINPLTKLVAGFDEDGIMLDA